MWVTNSLRVQGSSVTQGNWLFAVLAVRAPWRTITCLLHIKFLQPSFITLRPTHECVVTLIQRPTLPVKIDASLTSFTERLCDHFASSVPLFLFNDTYRYSNVTRFGRRPTAWQLICLLTLALWTVWCMSPLTLAEISCRGIISSRYGQIYWRRFGETNDLAISWHVWLFVRWCVCVCVCVWGGVVSVCGSEQCVEHNDALYEH